MKLIKKVSVDHFRSIRNHTIDGLGNFTVFAGPNNSGKSNLLRALHVFFNDSTDIGSPFDFHRDYYCHDLKSKKAKQISISVEFELPSTFRFRKGLESTQTLLGNSFTLKKKWGRDRVSPQFFLNDSISPLNREEQGLVEQFFSLISFRYIPNRVMPLEVIRTEQKPLRDVLIRRIAKKAKKQKEVFDNIQSTSANLIQALQHSVCSACPDVGSIRLATPLSWQDIIFAFGYKIRILDSEIDDSAQGSGIQSLLMFETLSLIDRDYFQKFGWRQAAIWAVEEPESSLHSSLEARVAEYLSTLASDPSNRLQVFSTTHSDLMIQYSDKTVFVSMTKGQTKFEFQDKATVLQEAAKRGISRWTHPILHAPLHPVVLVEGKYDCAFLEQAFRLIAPQKTIAVSYLERLLGGDATGGENHLRKYIKENMSAIKARSVFAPVLVLLDWDSAKKVEEFKKGFDSDDPYRVEVWPENAFNPNLDSSFHGIERHFSDRIIAEADKKISMIALKQNGMKAITKHSDYYKFKAAAKEVIDAGIMVDDLVHVRNFLLSLLESLDQIQEGIK